MKLSEELTKVREKVHKKFQHNLILPTQKLRTSFQKEINPKRQEIHYVKHEVKNLFEENMKTKIPN